MGHRATTLPGRRRIVAVGAAAAGLVPLLAARPAAADTHTWVAFPGDGSWSVAGNWSPAAVPAPGDVANLQFDAGGANRIINFAHVYTTALANVYVGADNGAATLNLQNGSRMMAADMIVAGPLSQFAGQTNVGHVTHRGGSNILSGNLILGKTGIARGVASYTLSGGDLVARDVYVGADNSRGTYTQSGGNANVDRFLVGFLVSGSSVPNFGTATLSGGMLTTRELHNADHFVHSGGTLTVSTTLSVSFQGTMSLSDSARLTAQTIGLGGASSNTPGHWVQSGGAATANTLTAAYGSTVSLSGGALSVADDATFGSPGVSATPARFQQTGGSFAAGGTIHFAAPNTTHALAGGQFTADRVLVSAGGTAVVNHTGTQAQVRTLELAGVTTYNLSNTAGLTLTGDEVIGGGGGGGNVTFNQSGGDHTIDGALRLAQLPGFTAVANLSAGTWRVKGNTFLSSPLGPGGGAATVNQTGGAFTGDRSIFVGGNAQSPPSAYNLAGGMLAAPSLRIHPAGSLNVGGGTYTIPVIIIDPGGTATFSGGNTTLPPQIANSGTLRVHAPLTLQGLGLAPGSVTQVDSTLSVTSSGVGRNVIDFEPDRTLQGTGTLALLDKTFVEGHGVLNLNLRIGPAAGVTSKGGTLRLRGPGIENAGTLANGVGTSLLIEAADPNSGAVGGNVTVNAGGAVASTFPIALANGNTVSMLGGALGAPGVDVEPGGSITGFGVISAPLTNRGSISLNAPTQLVGGLRNESQGTLAVRNSQLVILGPAVNNGTIRAHLGGSVVFDAGLTGNPVQGAAPAGAAVVAPSSEMIAPFVRQGSLTLSGIAGDPDSYALVRIRPRAQGGETSILGALTFDTDAAGAPLGTFDLADTALIIDYALAGPSPLTQIRGAVRSANAPASVNHWTGPGLTSSAAADAPSSRALGYGESAVVLGLSGTQTANWQGQPADATSLLVRLTLRGDVNLDGSVNFNDLATLAQNYNNTDGQRLWSHGDFTYDGNVNFDDLAAMAQNYNAALPASPIAGAAAGFVQDLARAVAIVPEPSSVVFIGLAALATGRVRRAHRRPLQSVP